jgi:hypothetical protein
MQRRVKVYKDKPGPDVLKGKATSNNRGRWSLPATGSPHGHFYALVKRRVEGTAGTIFICRRAPSKVRHF